jgi:hypothetical protein
MLLKRPCRPIVAIRTLSSNTLGLGVGYSYVTVVDAKLTKNTVGVKIPTDGNSGCATFTRTTFTKNDTNVVGEPICS